MEDEAVPSLVVVDSGSEVHHGSAESRSTADRSTLAPTPAERVERMMHTSTAAAHAVRSRPATGRGARAAGSKRGPEPRVEPAEPGGSVHPARSETIPTSIAVAAQMPELPSRGHEPAPPDRRTRQRSRVSYRAARTAVRLAVAATTVVVVSGTGFAYYTEESVDQGFTHSDVISSQDAAALDGDMNILLIGLDTRKDRNGNDLPEDIMDKLHAGDGSEGGYNANSLILVHIPKDLKKITAVSIPRDDYVAVTGIPGYDHVKIKEAYGLEKAAVEQKLADRGIEDKGELERQGREAGRESIVHTVKALTGVPINRIAEISLVGFYDLANILGGVEVCLNHAVDDEYYSGAVFPAGPQHLDAAQALSFVRQRHGLDNGDLDRTHRQQAFLVSVATQLEQAGTLTNIGRLRQLINAAQNDVVLSQGWNILDFAQTMAKAGPIPIEFRTLPVQGFQTIDGQDVNIVDPAAIRKAVRTAFGEHAPQPTTPTSTVDVVNAGSVTGMAAEVSNALAGKGFDKGSIGNAAYNDGSGSVVYYGTGAYNDATRIADMLGGLPTATSEYVHPGHVKIVIGSDFSLPDELTAGTIPSSNDDTAGSPTSATTSAAADASPDSGKPVTTRSGSSIPCVN